MYPFRYGFSVRRVVSLNLSKVGEVVGCRVGRSVGCLVGRRVIGCFVGLAVGAVNGKVEPR